MTKVLPVIHYNTIQQALDNAAIAVKCGCPGVFLISMHQTREKEDELDQAIMAVKYRFPELKVGGNYLTLGPLEALKRCLEMDIHMTWADKPGVTSFGANEEALAIGRLLRQHPEHQFFGSVAFKYQRHEPFPGQAAVAAANIGMIATTSGPATGQAVDVEKLRVMKNSLTDRSFDGPQPLALASGVSPDNAHLFTPYVDYFLVSTHISTTTTSDIISEEKLMALMRVCQQQN